MSPSRDLVGVRVPLASVGDGITGFVLSQFWSEALGDILRVAEGTDNTRIRLVYGSELSAILATLAPVAPTTVATPGPLAVV